MNIKILYSEIKDLNEYLPVNWEGECDSLDTDKVELTFQTTTYPFTVWVDLILNDSNYIISHYVSDFGNESEPIITSGVYSDKMTSLDPVYDLITTLDDYLSNYLPTSDSQDFTEYLETKGYDFT